MDEDKKSAQGCAIILGLALVTGGIAVAVASATHPAMGVALWLTLNGALPLLAAGASR